MPRDNLENRSSGRRGAGRSGRSSSKSSSDRNSGPKKYAPKKSSSRPSDSSGSNARSGSGRPFAKRSTKYSADDQGKRNAGGRKRSSSSEGPRKHAGSSNRTGGSRSKGKPFDKEEKRSFFNKDTRKRTTYKQDVATEAPAQTEQIRLNRYIANSGVCSRREADELISMGLISVNGTTITELGYKVNPGDEVRYENKILRAEKPVYILMNKPKGYLTTTDDPQERNTVMHILGGAIKERIYPVGRLDRNTTGLLLLTNDGDLADKLMHPSHNVKKIYKVELDRPLSKADFQTIADGVKLEEGRAMVDDLAIVSPDGKTVGVELHIGWNRVVRRIFEALNYQVVRLDRTVYAGLDKKDLGRGQWRHLRKEEILHLKHFK